MTDLSVWGGEELGWFDHSLHVEHSACATAGQNTNLPMCGVKVVIVGWRTLCSVSWDTDTGPP